MRFGLAEPAIAKIQAAFARFPEIQRAVMYGSRAKGNYRPGSDIDLTLYGERLTPSILEQITAHLDELLLPYTFDLSIFDHIEHVKLRDHIERVGQVFYEKDGGNGLSPGREERGGVGEYQGAAMKKGWQTKTLGEICDIERGGSPRPIQNFITTDPKGINWIKIGDATASGKYIYKTEEKIKPEGVKRSRMVYEGDFILSNSMSFGRPYIMKTTGCIHDGWLVLHQPKVDPDYLYHLLGSDLVFRQFDRLAAGSTVRNLNIGLAKSVEIPYPPLPEQQRIVGILDEAFEGIATAKANAEKNLQNARALFESHLQSVFTQRGKGWVQKRLGEMCERITKGSSPKWQGIAYVDAPGILFVTSENVGEYQIMLEHPKYVEAKFNTKDKKSILQKGDVLTNIVGASIGRTAVFDRDDVANINQAVCLIRCEPDMLSNFFLTYLLNSPVFKHVLHDNEVDNARANLSLGFFSQLLVPTPPLSEQRKIVAAFDAFREETQRLESIYQRKLAALDELKKSLLDQAFSGEL